MSCLLETNNIKLNNGTYAKFSHLGNLHMKIYEFENKKKYGLLENQVFHTISSEYEEPGYPLEDEWQSDGVNVYRFDNCQISLSNWEDYFKPIANDNDDGEMKFTTWNDAYKYTEENFSGKNHKSEEVFKPYQHIWSIVDGDSGKLILLNGYHKVNVLGYLICETPWGTGKEEDKNVYLEVEYEE